MTSFEVFKIIKFNIIHLFNDYLLFYLLKMIQYHKILLFHLKVQLHCFNALKSGSKKSQRSFVPSKHMGTSEGKSP